jgi:hypothetical protein
MITRKSTRAIIAVVTLALIAGLNTRAFAALSSFDTPAKSEGDTDQGRPHDLPELPS